MEKEKSLESRTFRLFVERALLLLLIIFVIFFTKFVVRMNEVSILNATRSFFEFAKETRKNNLKNAEINLYYNENFCGTIIPLLNDSALVKCFSPRHICIDKALSNSRFSFVFVDTSAPLFCGISVSPKIRFFTMNFIWLLKPAFREGIMLWDNDTKIPEFSP